MPAIPAPMMAKCLVIGLEVGFDADFWGREEGRAGREEDELPEG